MKKIKIFTIAFLMINYSFGQNNIWSLEECVKYAVENNITILQAKNSLLSSEQDIISAKGNFLPAVNSNISGSGSFGNIELYAGEFVDREFYSTSLGIGFSQNVFNGFRNINLLNQSKINFERNQLELKRLKDDISLNVANAYLNVLFNKENLELAKSQVDFSLFQMKQVSELVEAGTEPLSTLIESKATYSRDIQNLTLAENNHDLSLLNLAQLLQLKSDNFDIQVIKIDTPSANLLYNDINTILDYALTNRNEIKVAERDVELAKLGTKISKSAYLPNISMGYGFNASANFSNLSQDDNFINQINDNKGHSLNMNISIPIFNRNQTRTQVEKSRIQEKTTNLILDQVKLNLESTIQRAFTDARAALRTYEASLLSLESQELAFENANERFSLGALNTFDLEQARIRLLNAKSSLINAKYDFIFKTKVLDYYLDK
ncbi:MAG: transporter [Flavobacteriaceae bacterium]|nr:transporter [Flavobacteriaceae bacterium]|tara:strand:- start:825 stop:2132 length:1308 start_codon:yes stop_codon:yes gene_type:complete